MVKPLTQAALARALGLAPSRITAMKAQGMPTHSIEAARKWREQVRLYMKPADSDSGAVRAPSPYLDGLDDGWLAAYSAVRDFVCGCVGVERFGPVLAAMVDAMPTDALMRVPADAVVDDMWDALSDEFSRLAAGSEPGPIA